TVCLMVLSTVIVQNQAHTPKVPAVKAAQSDAAGVLAAYKKAAGSGRWTPIDAIVAEGEITRQFPALKSPLLFRFASPQKLQSLSLTDAANALGPASIT